MTSTHPLLSDCRNCLCRQCLHFLRCLAAAEVVKKTQPRNPQRRPQMQAVKLLLSQQALTHCPASRQVTSRLHRTPKMPMQQWRTQADLPVACQVDLPEVCPADHRAVCRADLPVACPADLQAVCPADRREAWQLLVQADRVAVIPEREEGIPEPVVVIPAALDIQAGREEQPHLRHDRRHTRTGRIRILPTLSKSGIRKCWRPFKSASRPRRAIRRLQCCWQACWQSNLL